MNTKLRTITIAVIISMVSIFSSCEKDEQVAKPIINNLELGIGDNKIAYIGADLHIEAEIIAEGKIDKITVEIHQEEGGSNEIVIVFDEFEGLKNTTFHKHIDIPATTLAGTYHLHLIVTDIEGNSTSVEDEISIEELSDDIAPLITITSSPESGQSLTNGDKISITGTVTDESALAGMLVALVYETDNISDADVMGDNTKVIVMLHTHTFDSETSHNFTASINVGSINDNNMTPTSIQGDNAWKSGNYYILVRCKDAKGNWAFSNHYDFKIFL